MQKSKAAGTDTKRIIKPKLARTMLRPLGLAELEHVPGAGTEVENDGIWPACLEGDGTTY